VFDSGFKGDAIESDRVSGTILFSIVLSIIACISIKSSVEFI
jgi:hypothetical protein